MNATLADDALRGVRTRRVVAVPIDLALVILAVGVVWFGITYGYAPIVAVLLVPFVASFYNGFTVSGPQMATPGMRAMDLEMRMNDTNARVPFVNAAVQAFLFYLSWIFPPIFLTSLIEGKKRCVHDIIAGVVIVRRRATHSLFPGRP